MPRHDLSTDNLTAILREHTQKVANRYVGVVTCGIAGPATATFATGRESLTGGTPQRRTSFHIGSVTKTFTALALADGVVTGALTLDTPLADIIKETPAGPDGEQITLGHPASHTSGLPGCPKACGGRRSATGPTPTATSQEPISSPPYRPPGPTDPEPECGTPTSERLFSVKP